MARWYSLDRRKGIFAGLAALLLSAVPGLGWLRSLTVLGLLGVLMILAMEALRSRRCPACFRIALKRIRRGHRDVVCLGCGQPWTRTAFTTWVPLEPASVFGPTERRRMSDPWRGGPVVDESSPTQSTHGRLLRVKQQARGRAVGEGPSENLPPSRPV